MAKKVPAGAKRPRPPANGHALALKRTTDEHGNVLVVRTVNADSSTFKEDLRFAFEQNVKKVRRELHGSIKSASKKR
ncbi:MAG TPA: hypothetical protein VFE70_02670 [Candidatus Elarobacter sp.]|nr:hypothetical protein [Candidatus Elarobacter sp.]